MIRLPYIAVEGCDGSFTAAAAWRLTSLETRRGRDPAALLRAAYQQSTRLVQLLARWAPSVTTELQLVSWPSLCSSRTGRVDVALRTLCRGGSRALVTEMALSNAIAFEGLLRSAWPYAAFQAIADSREYHRALSPFTVSSAVRLGRRLEKVPLAEVLEAATRQTHRFGFQRASPAPPIAEPSSPVIEHLFGLIWPADDWSVLMRTLVAFPAPQWILVRFRGAADLGDAVGRIRRNITECEKLLSGSAVLQPALRHQLEHVEGLYLERLALLSEGPVQAGVFLLAPGPADLSVACLLGQSVTASAGRAGAAQLFQGGFEVLPLLPQEYPSRDLPFESEPFTASEVACAFWIPPALDDAAPGLPIQRHHTVEALLPQPARLTRDRVLSGVNRHRGVERLIEIETADRLRHTFVLGMTGTGKSTLLLSLALQDIRAGRGLCLIDPHGDLADNLIARLPEDRARDLILIDLEDRDHPIPFNLLDWKTLDERDLIIDELYATVDRMYDLRTTGGPMFEQNFRAMLKLLMGDRRHDDFTPTLLEFPKLYRSRAFRHFLLERTEEEEVADFIHELESSSGECSLHNMAPYVTSKFSRFLHDSLLRRFVGHPSMAFDFRSILDHRKILLVKLARGRFSSSVSDLLTGQILSRFRSAAMARGASLEHSAEPFFLYADEFQNLADESASSLLSESRKYGLGLVVANQYASQLHTRGEGNGVLSALLGNVGMIACFRLGAEDAPRLEPVFAPAVTAQDLMECPNWQGYLRIHSSRDAVRPFSFHTVLDPAPLNPDRASAAISRSLAVSVQAVDRIIADRSAFIRDLG